MQTKICTKCGNKKSIIEFPKMKHGKYGVSAECKDCRKIYHQKRYKKYAYKYKTDKNFHKKALQASKKYREKNSNIIKAKNARLKKNFGITLEQYNQMLKEQNGVCAICGNSEKIIDKRINRIISLAIDHDHQTGKVRGLLCNTCNHLLGLANDNFEITKNATDYLKKHKD
jgi:hypothetical protein